MSEAKGQHEPSMEEILASIRRIIAEDGDGGGEPEKSPEPPRAAAQHPDEVLELTEVVDDDGAPVGLGRPPEPEPPPPPPPPPAMEREPPPPPRRDDLGERLVSESTAQASVAALSQLMGARDRLPGDIGLGAAGRTLEDLVRELLRPMLRNWLDDHLPPLVERLVREEIARLVREVQGR
jgi:cell pole-organizing protein PopZ